MPFTLELQEKPGYLHFQITGENTPAVVREYLGAVMRSALERKCPILLIEENLHGPPLPLIDVFDLASGGTDRARGEIRRIAFVDVNPDHPIANMQFAETVAVNRGLNVRVFATVEEAERWIVT